MFWDLDYFYKISAPFGTIVFLDFLEALPFDLAVFVAFPRAQPSKKIVEEERTLALLSLGAPNHY